MPCLYFVCCDPSCTTSTRLASTTPTQAHNTNTPQPLRLLVGRMALRYNDKDVVHMARTSRLRADRVGPLLKRGEANTAMKLRHFVLKANLLFYYKTATVRASRLPTQAHTDICIGTQA